MSRFYLAARFSRREEMKECRADLMREGHVVTSRWLDTHGTSDTNKGPRDHGTVDFGRRLCAHEDLEDILLADTLISFTEEPYMASYPGTGGRHVEYGYALAHRKRLILVGYRENVFHDLNFTQYYQTWTAFLQSLTK